MKPELQPGLSHECTEETTVSHSTSQLAKPVLSTPAMIAMMERCSVQLLKPYFEGEETSVGYRVNITHIAGTPIGQKVRVKATVQSLNGRRVVFAVEAYNEKEKIGEGEHERVIIDPTRFAAKSSPSA